MDKNAIKKFAAWARREMITRVAGRASNYGITQEDYGNPNVESIEGHVLTPEEKLQRAAFITKINQEGYEQAVEEVAYTWFNRFCALRYMEVNGYLPSHVRVFTNDAGEFKPQILDEAIHIDLNGLDMEKVYDYKDSDQEEELYRYLLIVQCNDLNSILPGMFQKIADYTELLMPDNLLRDGSVIEQMVTQIPEEDWTDQVQIIGWLYQYYNAEKKDEVFAALKKNVKITKDNIPAATQLFTPDWIVRYMVENSLGRLWEEGHPNDELKGNWKYYLEGAKQEPEVEEQLIEIRKEYALLTPEDIKCIDPCCGSGHILVYMFDVLMQIYQSYGYSTQDAVRSILENNLYGLDVDDRAAQLAYFSVMMKARSYDKKFFSRGIQPHVYALQESEPLSTELLEAYGSCKEIVKRLVNSFANAKDIGSLIEPDITLEELDTLEKQMDDMDYMADEGSLNGALFTYTALETVWPLLPIARILLQKYDVVVTNPPYMSAGNMNAKLNDFIKKNYADYKFDFFSAFIVRCKSMANKEGYLGFFSPYVWMFIQSYEKLRNLLYSEATIEALIQFEYSAFEEATVPVCTFVFQNSYVKDKKGCYFRLTDFRGGMGIQRQKTLEAISNHDCGYYFERCSDSFSKIPGEPVAYWITDSMINAFEAPKIGDYFKPKKGLDSADNGRFVRYWFEPSINKIGLYLNKQEAVKSKYKWFPLNSGGTYRKWYGNFEKVILWENDGIAIKNYPKAYVRANDYYFNEGLTWTKISSSKFGIRYTPEGFIFDSAGQSIFGLGDDIYYALGFLSSNTAFEMLMILNPTLNYQVGDIAHLPFICDKSSLSFINAKVKDNIYISKNDWDSFETSWDFQRHPLVHPFSTIKQAFYEWEAECEDRFNQLKFNEEELNRIFISIYGLQDELTPEEEDKDVTVRKADLQRDVKSLISYAVGCMFGRYSLGMDGLTYAGGEWDDSKYSTFIPDSDGIIPICDDEYFTDDIVGRFIEFVRIVYGEDTLEENLKYIADALGGSGAPRQVIRKYFLNDFFKDHCKTYQKRPIYWLFDSGKKNGFKCLIYMHRYQPDTIARIRTDYVHEQQARYRTAMADLQERIKGASTSDRIKFEKQLTKLQDQAEELQGYEEKIHHLADQFVDIDLDDGVKVNYAKFQDVLAKV